MVETEWPQLSGTEVEYGDHAWEFTGTVDVGETGDLLGVNAKQVDDVRQRNAVLRFGLPDGGPSLNPGDIGSHFETLERRGNTQHLVVKTEPRTYRYELQGIEYE